MGELPMGKRHKKWRIKIFSYTFIQNSGVMLPFSQGTSETFAYLSPLSLREPLLFLLLDLATPPKTLCYFACSMARAEWAVTSTSLFLEPWPHLIEAPKGSAG
jgi:hypothetical protein